MVASDLGTMVVNDDTGPNDISDETYRPAFLQHFDEKTTSSTGSDLEIENITQV